MARIALTNGGYAQVDDTDAELVSTMRWYGKTTGTRGVRYAQTRISGRTTYMHRLLLRALPGEVVDHKNGDGLDNRRSNIRRTSQSINISNTNATHAKSGYRGVYLCREQGTFMFELTVRGRITKRKGFATAEAAHAAYLAKRRELLGEDYVERAVTP